MVTIIVTGLSLCGLLILGLSFRWSEMSFTVDDFISALKLNELSTLKRSELVELANHYKLEVNSGMRKMMCRD